MLYQPKYCCNCSEKIERTKWRLWSSRRFCQLCETDFSLQEWTPRLIIVLGLVFGGVGVAGYFQNAEKPVKIASTRSSAATTSNETKKDSLGESPTEKAAVNSSVQRTLENTANTGAPARHQNALPAKPAALSKAPDNQASIIDTIYFCGAETKKGKPCSRRVKGGGRCWQHAGQPAVLPPDKLIASR